MQATTREGAPVEDMHAIAGWEIPAEALFVCRQHGTRAELEAEFGKGQVMPVTWARITLGTFTCAYGPHDVTVDDETPSEN